MADLLADIEASAIDDKISVVSLLRKAVVLAAALKSAELREWVDAELDGYRGRDDWEAKVPAYRRFGARALGNFSGYGGVIGKGLAIPPSSMPSGFRRYATVHVCLDGISNYESLLDKGDDSPGTLQVPWPSDLIVAMQSHVIYTDMTLFSAWQEIPRNCIVELVAGIRTRILRFVLDLREKSPGLTVEGGSPAAIAADVVHNSFHTYILGGSNSVAIDSVGVTQSVQVLKGDVTSLVARLTQIGVGISDIEELKDILAAEVKPPAGLGARCAAWVSRATEKFMGAAVDATAVASGTAVMKALLQFYGVTT